MSIFLSQSSRFRLADLLPPDIAVPGDVIQDRLCKARQLGDMDAVRLLEAAEECLQFTELLSRKTTLRLWERYREVRTEAPVTVEPLVEWSFDRLRDTHSHSDSDDQRRLRALTLLADKNQPADIRIQAAEDSAYIRHCTDDLLQTWLDCLADDESIPLRSEVLVAAHLFGVRAAAVVPRAIEILRTIPRNRDLETWYENGWGYYEAEPLHVETLNVIASCHTAAQPEAAAFLIERTDHIQFGIPTAWRTIKAISNTRSFHRQFLDRLIALAVDNTTPIPLREAALSAAQKLLCSSSPHLDSLCRLLTDPTTHAGLRRTACSSLLAHARVDNPIATAFASVVDDPTAPDDLRFRALCAFRSMAIEVQHVILKPAIRFARRELPLAAADIAQDLIADVIRLAVSALPATDHQDFLETALAAPFELRLRDRLLRGGQSAARSFLLGRDIVDELVRHTWLQAQFRSLLPRRMRSVANGTWEELLRHLSTYVIEILTHPDRPEFPDPDHVLSFPRNLIDRVDGYAKYHLPRDFGGRRPERPDVIPIDGQDYNIDIQDSWETPDATVAEDELSAALTLSLSDSLTNLERQVLFLVVVDGFSLDEVARVVGKSRFQVFRTKETALKKLRSTLRLFAG